MAELAQLYMSLTDDSLTPSIGATDIPLYFIATRENKVLDETTNKIAPATMKSVANELMVFNSPKTVIDSFGIPYFEENNGTINQDSEVNEWGLFGLYDVLGITNTAYVVRADIDLAQLDSSASAPTSKAKNGTKWFDLSQSSMGYFRANGNVKPALAWDNVEVLFVDENNVDDNGVPLASVGSYGNIAMTTFGTTYKTYENFGDGWYEIGSDEWTAQFPSSIAAKNSNLPVSGNSFTANDVVITFGDEDIETIEKVITKINASFADGSVVASNQNGKLKLSTVEGVLTLVDGTGSPLTYMGFPKDEQGNFVISTVSLYHSSHTNYPDGSVAGSIWVKTTSPNNGSNYVVKTYVSSTNIWNAQSCPLYDSFLDAESGIGANLQSGSLFALYGEDTAVKILSYQGANPFAITGDTENPIATANDVFSISTLVNGYKTTARIELGDATTVPDVITKINKAAIAGITAEIAEDNKNIRIISNNGSAVELTNVVGNSLESLGLSESEFSNWVLADVIASTSEPTSDPEEGTLWFNNTFSADVLVNDGKSWKGYNNTLSTSECDPNGIQLASSEPTTQSDGTPLVDGDLWLNTADSENYPAIYRFSDGKWDLIDNSDQSTPFGILFADARENAGPSYEGSVHTAFSTKGKDFVKSDYVDPDCPDPRAYPAGIILFNMRFATNNVKQYAPKMFADAVATYGETFKVGGDDTTPSFPTPGTTENQSVARWIGASGNDANGVGLFGRKAQRKLVVEALAKSIKSNEDVRSDIYDFIVALAPGYPELDDELLSLSADKKEFVYTISDTPKHLAPRSNDILQWATNYNNAPNQGEDGRTLSSYLITRQYPPMGLASNVDGNDVAIPSSIIKVRNWLQTPRGEATAGSAYGRLTNASSVGYINEEGEYTSVMMSRDTGNSSTCTQNNINPILYIKNYGLLFWDELTENGVDSNLSDEHTVKSILHLKRDLDRMSVPYFHKIYTPKVRDNFKRDTMSILNEYVARGEFYDYVCVCDDSNNYNERIARHELWEDIAISSSSTIKFIYIPIRVQSIATFNK